MQGRHVNELDMQTMHCKINYTSLVCIYPAIKRTDIYAALNFQGFYLSCTRRSQNKNRPEVYSDKKTAGDLFLRDTTN